jgi:hypothetical protein
MKQLIFILTFMLLFSFVSATNIEQQPVKINQNQKIVLNQVCANSTYSNITSGFIDGTNIQLITTATAMIELSDNTYSYNWTNTTIPGKYYFYGICDENGEQKVWGLSYEVKSSSNYFFILLICLASLFFIATLFVNEEFFVYISGVLYLVAGIYSMINGIDIVNDWYSRAISYVLIGIGFLFTIGAYIFNSYEKNSDEEEY